MHQRFGYTLSSYFLLYTSLFFIYPQYWLSEVKKLITKHVHKASCQIALSQILFAVLDRAT